MIYFSIYVFSNFSLFLKLNNSTTVKNYRKIKEFKIYRNKNTEKKKENKIINGMIQIYSISFHAEK